jgi:hypothetical protein
METSKLTGAALDWAVALCEGWQPERVRDNQGEYWWLFKEARGMNPKHYHPSTHWGIGGRIIEREHITLRCYTDALWDASIGRLDYVADGTTPLIAAMRCYVASKLGDEVQLPEGV